MDNKHQNGENIFDLCRSLFPICRSITGDGVRKSLGIINDYLSSTGVRLNIVEVPTGTKAFDWEVPKEWRIRSAYIEDENGTKIVDFMTNNLHVVGYSAPIDQWMTLDELNKIIYTQPETPNWIPYVTSYYEVRSGFCMNEEQRISLKPGKYHAYIDSELFDGSLTYADLILKGREEKEILFTSYICHPSMANNECSGPSLLAELIKYVSNLQERRYTYRFVIEPESIGAITYISQHLSDLQKNVVAAFNLTCVGDDGPFSLIHTPDESSLSDRVMDNILSFYGWRYDEYSFLDRGSDEKQYNSPGVDIPMICFCRSKFGKYPEYHTSADNLDFVSPSGFQRSYNVIKCVIDSLEVNYMYRTKVLCEPQLGKRGLYPTVSQKNTYGRGLMIKHFLAYANGKNDLIEISNKIKIPIIDLASVVDDLVRNNLIERIEKE